jgi:PAS domain S-box-containing protein
MEPLGVHHQLRAGLARYRSLFEQAPVAYLVTDRFGVVGEANRHAAGLLGTVRRFLLGRPLTMFVPGDDRAHLRDHLGRLQRPGVHGWELRLQPRRGTPRPPSRCCEPTGSG